MKTRLAIASVLLAAIAGLILSSCSSVTRTVVAPPEIEGAHFVGNKACVDCHENITRVFPSSPHARFYKEDLKWAGQTGCESCHGAGSKHINLGGGRRNIINPGKDPSICYNCHLEAHAEFNLPHHHPIVEGRMNCVQCHDPHGHEILKPSSGLAMARLNESCASCHREESKPMVFEHEALREGCTTCHSPHGSMNPKMLVEPGNNLCLRCHAQVQAAPGQVTIGKVPHSEFVRRATCWSAGCHTAVHGSNINPKLQY
jgi:predicted CXXCH cytochrome family protein